MQKLLILIVVFSFIYIGGTAQIKKKESLGINSLSAFVYSDNNTGYFIQQSIGQQSVINTFDTNNFSLRQGFLQPINPLLINHRFDTKLEAIVFPNPFSNQIQVKFLDPVNRNLIVRIFDMSGRLIFRREYEDTQNLNVIIGEIATGIYNLRIDNEDKFFESKLIKR